MTFHGSRELYAENKNTEQQTDKREILFKRDIICRDTSDI